MLSDTRREEVRFSSTPRDGELDASQMGMELKGHMACQMPSQFAMFS